MTSTAYAKDRLDAIQRPKDVHFTPEGSAVLAQEVSRHVLRQLPVSATIARAQKHLSPPSEAPAQTELPALLPETPGSPLDWPEHREALLEKLAFYEYGFAPGTPSRLRFPSVTRGSARLGWQGHEEGSARPLRPSAHA